MITQIFNRALNFSLNQLKFYSTDPSVVNDNNANSNNNITPVKSYENADTLRLDTLKENKGKSGIYRWVNNSNGKSYVGSAIDLSQRLRQHYNGHRSNILLQNAIKKYGLSNFSIQILEYCDKKYIISREQYYFNSLKPEFNLNPTAGSKLGSKQTEATKQKTSKALIGRIFSEETRKKLSEAQLGEKNHFFGKVHSEVIRQKISKAMKGKNSHLIGELNPMFGNTHSQETKDKMSRAQGTTIYVYSLESELLYTFSSATKAEQYFRSRTETILKYARSNAIFRKEYILSLTELSSTSTKN